ncbi:hypothetical protein ABID12_002595 [Martelella mangrovi]|uniref:HTH-like domain-containing protein n=1 Tax=Martelella mangrovi TaxID=1397477 RepID=A0ABV2ICI8_9HYPH
MNVFDDGSEEDATPALDVKKTACEDRRLIWRWCAGFTRCIWTTLQMLQGLLTAEGHKAGRRHARTLMKKIGIDAIYRRPNTSKPAPGHKIYPYLLKALP